MAALTAHQKVLAQPPLKTIYKALNDTKWWTITARHHLSACQMAYSGFVQHFGVTPVEF